MTAKPAGLPGLSRTAVGREVIIQDFLPSLQPGFRMLLSFINVGAQSGFFDSSKEANDFGNERAQEFVSHQFTHYMQWTDLKSTINPDDLNSLMEEVGVAASAYLGTIAKEFEAHVSSTEDETPEEGTDD